ncbi:MAG: class I SAM-dependent methyltransferase, partial [Pseudomonadales bacterium]
MTQSVEQDIHRGERFKFGANWSRYIDTLDEVRIGRAEATVKDMLGVTNLHGKTFLDIGSGSGLFSLVAARMGAAVRSFDYDPQSVSCTKEVKRRYSTEESPWEIEQGSVLDREYLSSLGEWDVVYSWGVLHHTGQMWQALENVTSLVRSGGQLYIAIYNDQKGTSRRWLKIKKMYNRHVWLRPILLVLTFLEAFGMNLVVDAVKLRPFRSIRHYYKERGMSPYRDLLDWVGGLPFEVAAPEAIF